MRSATAIVAGVTSVSKGQTPDSSDISNWLHGRQPDSTRPYMDVMAYGVPQG